MEIVIYALLAALVLALMLIAFCACRYLGTTNAALIGQLAQENAWRGAFLSRMLEIAFRETITADALGAQAHRALAPADPSPPPAEGEEGEAGEVVSLDAALEREAQGEAQDEAKEEGKP